MSLKPTKPSRSKRNNRNSQPSQDQPLKFQLTYRGVPVLSQVTLPGQMADNQRRRQ